MKAIAIVLLSFCSLLISGYQNTYAADQQNTRNYSNTLSTQKILQATIEQINHVQPLIKNANLSDTKEDFISLAYEDEDSALSRKYALLTKYFIILVYASALASLHDYVKKPLPFCWHFSNTSIYKYLFHRVLRI